MVRTVSAWGDVSSHNRRAFLERAIRPAWLGGSTPPPRILGEVVFEVVNRVVSVLEVMVLLVGLKSLHVVSLLGVLPLVLNTGMGGVVALRWRGGTVHGLPFVVLVLLQLERDGSPVVVFVVAFMVVALVGKMSWIVLTPLLSKWLGTGFTLLVLTPVLSRLFAHVLVF
jgi:hypothetical protein